MADIILKDKNDNTTEYPGVTQLRVPGYDVDGNATTFKFTHFSGMHCYTYIPLGDSVQITHKILRLANSDIWFTGINTEEIEEWGYQMNDGTYGVGILITTNGDLVVGNTYTGEELFGGD